MKGPFHYWLNQLADAEGIEFDNEEERIRRAVFVFMIGLGILAATIFGTLYLTLHRPLPTILTFGYAIFSLLGVLTMVRGKNYQLFATSQFILVLIIPFLLQATLGGILSSGLVILWAIFSPVGALMLYGGKKALPWLGGFLLTATLATVFNQRFSHGVPWLPANVSLFLFAINFIGVSTFIFSIVTYFATELKDEQDRSERLLLNILPRPIARRLKRDSQTIADSFSEVTVLFADIVGFTPLSARTTPEELVALLNQVFSSFDTLAAKFNLEKIKTIGDAYMVAGGIPVIEPDHAEKIAKLSLEMIKAIKIFNKQHQTELNVRIGINSGPVIAGVIGLKKFIYDLWGDTVNTASRMESHSQPGRIQVAAPTYELLKKKFSFEPRGTIEVKGKGPMKTYFLLKKK